MVLKFCIQYILIEAFAIAIVTCHVAYRVTRPSTEEILDIEIIFYVRKFNHAIWSSDKSTSKHGNVESISSIVLGPTNAKDEKD